MQDQPCNVCGFTAPQASPFACRDEAVHVCCAAAEKRLPQGATVADQCVNTVAAKPVISSQLANTVPAVQAVQTQSILPSASAAPAIYTHQHALHFLNMSQHLQQPYAGPEAQLSAAVGVDRCPSDHVANSQYHHLRPSSCPRQRPLHQQQVTGTVVPLHLPDQNQATVPTAHPHPLPDPGHVRHASFPQHSRLTAQQLQNGGKGQQQASYGLSSAAPTNASIAEAPAATNSCSGLSFQDIQHRAKHFSRQMHLLPPLAPCHTRCAFVSMPACLLPIAQRLTIPCPFLWLYLCMFCQFFKVQVHHSACKILLFLLCLHHMVPLSFLSGLPELLMHILAVQVPRSLLWSGVWSQAEMGAVQGGRGLLGLLIVASL